MKVYALALAVSLAVLFTASDGRAMTGQELNEACSDEVYFNKGLCSGYINGVFDAAEVFDEDANKGQWVGGWTACVPAGVKVGQLVAVVKKWLREHPEGWHYSGNSQVARAFDETWPCD